MSDFLGIIISILGVLITMLTSFAVIFAAITTWYGFKYRRDANLNLRKDYHITISETYENFVDALDDPEKMKQEKFDIKLLGFFNSPLSKKGYRRNLKLKGSFGKAFLLNQFKNWDSIEENFYLRKKVKINTFALKNDLLDEKITDSNELVKLLALVCIALFTDSIDMIKVDTEYQKIINYFTNVASSSPRQLKKAYKTLGAFATGTIKASNYKTRAKAKESVAKVSANPSTVEGDNKNSASSSSVSTDNSTTTTTPEENDPTLNEE